MKPNEIIIRKASERGLAEHGWLHSRFSFSFGSYFDPKHMGFHALRVINDDIIEPGEGFGTHPHENMEIISYVVEGALEHKDSMGTGSVVRPNDVQRMSAGSGITHSEFNPLGDTPMRLLQIWIKPGKIGVDPSYEQKTYLPEDKTNRLRLVASPNGAEGSVTINQDARIYASILEPGAEVVKSGDGSRNIWVQVVNGKLKVDDAVLETGDGASIEKADDLVFQGLETAEFLVFDLA
ncbi:pirin family protein [Pontiellaceae bacterium B12219]|nr:pirin family protein [Pontiellaceae bacterium B12219]